jgi:lipoprotein-releasing system ATP-binding protein
LLPEFSALENVMIPAMKLNKISKEEIEEKAYQNLALLG